jgi:hypothetical protein
MKHLSLWGTCSDIDLTAHTQVSLEIWHDGKGESPGWHLASVEVQNVTTQRKAVFVCNDWLCGDTGDRLTRRCLVAGERNPLGEKINYKVSEWTQCCSTVDLSVTQRALSVTQRALSVTQRALNVTLRALSVTQRALSVTQRALSVTQRALSVTQRALNVTLRALSVTQRALSVTQRDLRKPYDNHKANSSFRARVSPPYAGCVFKLGTVPPLGAVL